MKTRQFVAILGLLAGWGTGLPAQTATVAQVNPQTDDPVVIEIYGKQFRRSDVERLRRFIPAEFRANTQNMSNRAFLESFGYLQALASKAREDGFLEREPYRTQYEFNEINFLANSYLQNISASMKITDEEKQAYYDQFQNQFQEFRVSAIYLNYTAVPELAEKQGKPVVAEADIRAKAESLRAQLTAGADFAELAKVNSEDAASAQKGGDLGFFKPSDPLSPAIKKAVFSMKVGDVSEPIADQGRIYLFKVTEQRVRPLADVKTEVERAISNGRLTQRMEEVRKDVKIVATDQEWLDRQPGR